MRAAFYDKTGPANEVLQLGELPTPSPAAGEVRVKVQWSGVNPSDVKSRRGRRTSNPVGAVRQVPHSDASGIIDAVGEGVPKSRVGEKVWTWNGAWRRTNGTCSEFVVLPSAQAVKMHEGVPMEAGACFGIPALTACHAVITDDGVAGRRVLVAGGAGAVGHYAIQFAKLTGAAQVITTVSGPDKAAAAKAAGADVVINYKTENVAERVMAETGGHGVDRIIEVDTPANIVTDLNVLADDGIIIVYGSGAEDIPVPFFPAILKNTRMRFFAVYTLTAAARARAEGTLQGLLSRGALAHQIAARIPLDRIVEAHELVEQGKVIGNVVVQVG
jgi:NADPH2:quinone reductase